MLSVHVLLCVWQDPHSTLRSCKVACSPGELSWASADCCEHGQAVCRCRQTPDPSVPPRSKHYEQLMKENSQYVVKDKAAADKLLKQYIFTTLSRCGWLPAQACSYAQAAPSCSS